MITADQIVCHLVGDYLLQSDWMAQNKTKNSFAAFVHVCTYALPFLFLSPSLPTMMILMGTHFVIDRWRLARYVVWFKNFLGPGNLSWKECQVTGYPPNREPWMAVWLLIIADNIIHILINGLAFYYF